MNKKYTYIILYFGSIVLLYLFDLYKWGIGSAFLLLALWYLYKMAFKEIVFDEKNKRRCQVLVVALIVLNVVVYFLTDGDGHISYVFRSLLLATAVFNSSYQPKRLIDKEKLEEVEQSYEI